VFPVRLPPFLSVRPLPPMLPSPFSIRLSLPLNFFFFNATAPTDIYTLSLHDALPIFALDRLSEWDLQSGARTVVVGRGDVHLHRSEEHTSELQSRRDLVCRLLLEKKKTIGKMMQQEQYEL